METIKQRIERRADKYFKKLRNEGHSVNSTIERYNGYIQGATDQQEIFNNLPKIKAWIARDRNGALFVYHNIKPHKKEVIWSAFDNCLRIKNTNLPRGCNPQWEDEEPIEIELIINLKKG